MADGPPVVLDISRSVARAGVSQATGIDRVERAYFDRFLLHAGEVRFLARVPGGQFVLDRPAARALSEVLTGGPAPPRPDLRARLAFHRNPAQRQAESLVRKTGLALDKTTGRDAMRGSAYLNVGHTNLSALVLERLRQLGCARFFGMLHDTIPLDHPDWSSRQAARSFPDRFRALAQADTLICNSAFTQQRASDWGRRLGLALHTRVIALGVSPIDAPLRETQEPPRFLVLGTIEPRKNLDLLLDIWRQFNEGLPQGQVPHLDIVGRRGWRVEGMLARLAAAPFFGKNVHELGAIDDPGVLKLMARSRALLFPSLAEGCGLPVLEALQARLPVICNSLPALVESVGGRAMMIDASDREAWAAAILHLAAQPARTEAPFLPPRWTDHFAMLDSLLGS